MKGQLQVTTPEDYLAAVAPERRADIAALHALIREVAPALPPFIYSGMLGYGPIHYKYASGREGDAARLALASNAQYISLYALAADERGYVAERYRGRLPKASIGKSCVRFKRLADLDLAAIRDLVRETIALGLPGVDGPPAASAHKSAAKPTTTTKPAKSPASAPAKPSSKPVKSPAGKPSSPKPTTKPAKSRSAKPAKTSSPKPAAKPSKTSSKPSSPKPSSPKPAAAAAKKPTRRAAKSI